MKIICWIAAMLILLSGCTSPNKAPRLERSESQEGYKTGVWLSFSEINGMLEGDFKKLFGEALQNCADLGITDIFVHTRAFGDSLFPSSHFPLNQRVQGYSYDVMEYMINECHKKEMRFHAWINPYRIARAETTVDDLSEDSTVRKWLSDEDAANDKNVCIHNGIYLNPSSYEARRLIINGIREIITAYAVDGIHFDDYFYPTTDASFDEQSYGEYASLSANPLALGDWRRANVNALISGCYTAIKFVDKDIIFSVSPAASIEKNYNEYYADVSAWVKSGCVDVIIPQLYFGFEYPDEKFRFENLLGEWKDLTREYECNLHIGVAPYKIGTNAEPDCLEWQDAGVLARQTEICFLDEAVSGHSYFSYSSLFSSEPLNASAREKLQAVKKEPA